MAVVWDLAFRAQEDKLTIPRRATPKLRPELTITRQQVFIPSHFNGIVAAKCRHGGRNRCQVSLRCPAEVIQTQIPCRSLQGYTMSCYPNGNDEPPNTDRKFKNEFGQCTINRYFLGNVLIASQGLQKQIIEGCIACVNKWAERMVARGKVGLEFDPNSRTPYCSYRRSPKCPNRTPPAALSGAISPADD